MVHDQKDMSVMVDAQLLASGWEADIPFRDAMFNTFVRAIRGDGLMFATDDDAQLRAACGAGLLKASDEDKEWIKNQLDGLRKLSALITAGAAGLSINMDGFEAPTNPRDYGLMQLYHEAKNAVKR